MSRAVSFLWTTLMVSLLLVACGGDDEPEVFDCKEQFQEVVLALSDFTDDEDDCDKYAKALQTYIDNSCDISSNDQFGSVRLTPEAAQETLDGLDCN